MKESFNRELEKHREESSTMFLTDKVTRMDKCLDDEDAYNRRECLIFSGNTVPASKPDENCGNIVKNIVKEKLHLQQNMDISIQHCT